MRERTPPPFEPYSLQPATGERLIGREEVKQELQQLLSGKPSIVLLTGERGIGKTSLLRDLSASASGVECISYPAGLKLGFWDGIGGMLEKQAGIRKGWVLPWVKIIAEAGPAGTGFGLLP